MLQRLGRVLLRRLVRSGARMLSGGAMTLGGSLVMIGGRGVGFFRHDGLLFDFRIKCLGGVALIAARGFRHLMGPIGVLQGSSGIFVAAQVILLAMAFGREKMGVRGQVMEFGSLLM